LELLDRTQDRRIENFTAHAGHEPSQNRAVHGGLQAHGLADGALERLCNPLPFDVADRRRDSDPGLDDSACAIRLRAATTLDRSPSSVSAAAFASVSRASYSDREISRFSTSAKYRSRSRSARAATSRSCSTRCCAAARFASSTATLSTASDSLARVSASWPNALAWTIGTWSSAAFAVASLVFRAARACATATSLSPRSSSRISVPAST